MSSRPAARFAADDRTLRVWGELDDPELFTTELARHLEQYAGSVDGSAPRVDLTEVTFLPSSAIGVLARAGNRAARSGGEFEVVTGVETISERVLRMCGFPHVVE